MHGITDAPRGRAELRCSRPTTDTLLVEFSGSWRLQDEFPALAQLFQTLAQAQRVGVDADAPRLAAAGLSAAEVGARLAEIEDLRNALGELN